MFGNRWRLMRLLGIPIYVDASWLIILALLTMSFAQGFPALLQQVFPQAEIQSPPSLFWIMGLVTALTFFVCILLHELGHAIMAQQRGMSLRGITLFLFGGVAEITEESPSALTEFLVAIAGPAVSLVLTVLFGALAALSLQAQWPWPIVLVSAFLAFVNGMVLVFNLVPAFPLDGGRILRAMIWGATGNLVRATWWASLAGQGFAWFLIAWGLLEFVSARFLDGIWMSLIGMFLNSAARSSYQQVLLRQALQGEPIRHFMHTEPIVVPASLSLREWLEDYVYRYHRKAFPVVSGDRLQGVIDTTMLNRVPRFEWDRRTVGEVMAHNLSNLSIGPEADALEAFSKMQRTGSNGLLVTEHDHLLGLVRLDDLLRFLSLKLELEGPPTGPEPEAPYLSPRQPVSQS